ncbi:protein ENHANCED DOWNY MILDEW 2 isoform X2 [Physcomitrium patens]|uniref:protein ENHANCED DOWNY MILDEW 2 isoform X2 n=1 Tax=Physcomitrium patens TaxID=3218 RepID=UPI003CCCBD78
MEEVECIEDFFLVSGDQYHSLMLMPFAVNDIPWVRPEVEKVHAQGKRNGIDFCVEIDLWRLKLSLKGKPKFFVHQVTGAWMELRKPHDFYLETMKVVLVAAYFLTFAKQNPNSSKGDVWRFVRKQCSGFKAKPSPNDLQQAYLLLKSVVKSDLILQESPIIPLFFPNLCKVREPEVVEVCERLHEDVQCPPVSRALTYEDPSSGEKTHTLEASSLQGDAFIRKPIWKFTKRKCNVAEIEMEPDLFPPNILTPEPKKKPGRSLLLRSVRKKRKETDEVGDDNWIDEPDVCAFCDDGVENGEKLLCCEGLCMRSFHPTINSGLQNKCRTLGLSPAAVNVKSWICPNCEAGQHQCFACGKLGSSSSGSSSNSMGLLEVVVCGAKYCQRFYHPDCVVKLLVPEAEQKDLAMRIRLSLETLICPLHKCVSCNLDEDKKEPSLRLMKCRRCPLAWHEKCLPEECRSQVWPLEDGKCVMYCGRHRIDPELLTPERDHILFPPPKPKTLAQDLHTT